MLRVLVVDDHAVVREGLKRIIDDAPGMKVVGEAGEPAQALHQVQAGAPDVVVLDLDLPGRGGLELLRDIKSNHPKLPVLILSFHNEEAYGVPALHAGADGYLMKDSGTALLVSAIEKVAAGVAAAAEAQPSDSGARSVPIQSSHAMPYCPSASTRFCD